MKKRERGKGKKAGWIYSAVCVGMLLAVGTGWLFLESRCKEIEKQTQEIDAGAVLQKEERKEVLKRRQTLLEEKEEAEAKTRQEKQQMEEAVRAPFGNGRYGRADPEQDCRKDSAWREVECVCEAIVKQFLCSSWSREAKGGKSDQIVHYGSCL